MRATSPDYKQTHFIPTGSSVRWYIAFQILKLHEDVHI